MRRTRWVTALAAAVVASAAFVAAGCGSDDDATAGAATTPASAAAPAGGQLLASATAIDDAAGTATIPLLRGVGPGGDDVYYVVTESSDEADAAERGVTHAPKLANALGTKAVQKVGVEGDTVTFAGTVDFSPERSVTPGPEGFPPDAVTPGQVGDARYSPLITSDDRVVLNASQVRNDSGTHDAVVDIDTEAGTVTLKTLTGFFNGSRVSYFRLDASVDVVAALEESTLAPNLGEAPGQGSNARDSARSAIVPIVNGVRAADDPDRQGLQSAVLGNGSPLNITQSLPGAPDYSPLWDVTPAVWTPEAIAAGDRVLVTGNEQIAALASSGALTSAGEGPAHAELGGLKTLGAVSNCPTVAISAG
jgi:hypothetical protein